MPACLLAGCLLSVGCSSYSNRPEAHPSASADDESTLRVHHDAVSLFVPPRGGEVAIPVSFRNPSSTSTLELELVSKSCECAGFETTPKQVGPGGEGVMTLRTTFGPASENRRLRLRFATGLDQPENIVFTVEMRAFPAIEFQPSVSQVLAIPFGRSADLEFDLLLHQPEQEPAIDPEISSRAGELTVSVAGEDEQVDHGVRRRTIHCVASIDVPSQADFDRSPVVQEAVVAVQCGDHAATLPVLWRPQNLIRCEPKSLLVNAAQRGNTQRVELTSEAGFRILSLDTGLLSLVADVRLETEAKRHVVKVSLDGSLPGKGPRKFSITATTDHPQENRVEIPVYVLQ